MIEIYASSRIQDGGKANEDAFLIHRTAIPFAALCDGAGYPGQTAKRVLSLFEKLFKETNRDDIESFPTWVQWIKLLDGSLSGGNQSTFVAIAAFEDRYVGACVGDSMVYWRNTEGQVRLVTENAANYRLGSGKIDPFPIYLPCNRGDVLLIMSDGAWTPLDIHQLRNLLNKLVFNHLSELPPALLDEAGKYGKKDDMTVIAMKKIS
jgi:serine/threonine protein phosphatase PrpC